MGIKKYRPTTPARRYYTVNKPDITKKEPEKSLIFSKKNSGGRNNLGRITARHRGGGHHKIIRMVDFRRDKDNISAVVQAIEYDPNRSALLALLAYADGEKRYIICPEGLSVGDSVISGEDVPIKIGNCLPMRSIPLGVEIHNIELSPNKGAELVRSAGLSCQLLAKEGRYGHIKLPSGEIRLIDLGCRATIGKVSNALHSSVSMGKAGRTRHQGIRPHVRGVAMNPIDHPLGGGEGKSHGGRQPVSPWGWLTKGKKTRKAHKASDKFILKRRK
ncbi:MAG TPA: 50S ribosomal protein L2 [candidate division WOR-3 bacterium]|uniref:Large ribosomal subunit protein uL2 n=1 Tax=candidate division WOR-3 bacterium TaxID=2052148 RepID=A0A9C9ELL3_UNCW3|nr:50S ribosomal protein L2 [candidate division WOR-3 bacterium]